MKVSKNGEQFRDDVRLMARCGSRRDETLRPKWIDVDWANERLTIGSDGLSKNGEARKVDFNPKLRELLSDMHGRRAPDSDWMFPSPQRGDKDRSAKSFKDTLRAARKEAKLPGFGFHDCQRHFISMAVMSGIDYTTIASWVGHKDGGVLIGRVHGHLADDPKKEMARRLAFEPQVVEVAAS